MAGDGPPGAPVRALDRRTGTFRSDAARRRFLAAYEHAFAALWPTPRSEGDVDTEFGTTHFHRCGSRAGVPIVLLHGATSNAVVWYPFVCALGAAHPVIALDTVGDPGRSTARVPIDEPVTSAAWLDQTLVGLSVDRAHLIGHSYGGWLALNQAVHAPERLVSVAALDPGGVAKVSWRFIWLMYLHGLAGLAPAPLRRRLAVWLDNPVLVVPELKKVLLSGALNFRTTRPAPAPLSDLADRRQVVSGSDDKKIQVWELATGQPVRTLTGHTNYVSAVAVTPNGRQVVSGSHDDTARVWDLARQRGAVLVLRLVLATAVVAAFVVVLRRGN